MNKKQIGIEILEDPKYQDPMERINLAYRDNHNRVKVTV